MKELDCGTVVYVRREDYDELLEAIRTVNKLHDLGDSIYNVRDTDEVREWAHTNKASSWDAPDVKEYAQACAIINVHLDRPRRT